ncbi:MAG TPA: hypothetical protein VL155_04065 [Terriglobales bacterium]|nr:hypothetical protein [Terriglobales bacterium]
MRCTLVLVLLGAAPALFAQRMGGGGGGGAHSGAAVAGGGHFGGGLGHGGLGHSPGFGVGHVRPGIVGGFHHRGFRNNRFVSPFWSTAYWWDDSYYPDSGEQVVQPPATSVIVQQAAPQPVQEVKPASPLLIELQGNRFVRLTGNDVNPPVTGGTVQLAAREGDQLPPVVLIFRDGHRQDVSSYSIIGPALYVSGSYWTNGYWTEKILLADLNLPATMSANQERGVNFALPSAPNQVITRP